MVSHEMHNDHYIANTKNARIRTSQFKDEILDVARKNPGVTDKSLVELIYDKAFTKTAVAPVEPEEDVLICRYFTPIKFMKFIATRKIAFPIATQFDDNWECVIPEDYDLAVLRIFAKLNRSGTIWEKYVKTKASSWNISCWTELDDYFDDHLMWEVYSKGRDGRRESLFLRKLVLGIPAQASGKNLTRPPMPSAARIRPRFATTHNSPPVRRASRLPK